ncbi:MAG: hypothetical protein ABI837_08120 [Acidobacteriota bacterium]
MSDRSRFILLSVAASVAFAALAAPPKVKTLIRISPVTIPAGTTEHTISVDVHAVRAELLAAAKSRNHDVTLELDVEAERSPDVYYEVQVSVPKGKRYKVGNVALFGAGIRAESRGEFHPAHVQLMLSEALASALRNPSTRTLRVTFIARGAEGVPSRPSAAALRIDKGEVVVGPRLRE